jgi:hypothetical protein
LEADGADETELVVLVIVELPVLVERDEEESILLDVLVDREDEVSVLEEAEDELSVEPTIVELVVNEEDDESVEVDETSEDVDEGVDDVVEETSEVVVEEVLKGELELELLVFSVVELVEDGSNDSVVLLLSVEVEEDISLLVEGDGVLLLLEEELGRLDGDEVELKELELEELELEPLRYGQYKCEQ